MMVRSVHDLRDKVGNQGPEAWAWTPGTIRFRSYEQIQLARDIPEHPKIGYLGTLSYLRVVEFVAHGGTVVWCSSWFCTTSGNVR